MTNEKQAVQLFRPLVLFDKVRIKSLGVVGYIVDIVQDSYTVEKEGNRGPIYWNLPADDLEIVKE
jgi:hypothetical protein